MGQSRPVVKSSLWYQVGQAYREILDVLLHSPAAWVFSVCWLLSLAYLLLAGYARGIFLSVVLVLLIAVLSLLTIPLTVNVQPVSYTSVPKARLWIQLGIVMFFVLLTGYEGLFTNGAIAVQSATPSFAIPSILFLTHLPPAVINPLFYFVLPVLFLLPTGIRWRAIGFAHGYRSWAVTLLWCVPMMIVIIVALFVGGTRISTLALALLRNSLNNGFFEEFLFRGVLMAILIQLLNRRWGIVLSSLLFGLWHLGTNTASFGGSLLAGAAFGIVSQAAIGLGFAIVVYRTRSLLASSIIHVMLDVAFS
jgi:membrane protease YdiL (CAAX protease family)